MTALSLLVTLIAPGIFSADAPDTFRDMNYSGIQIGRDRDKDIKSMFKTEKGAVRPEALKLVTDRPRDYRADALLDGRGGDAIVRAVRVEYFFGAPTVDDLQRSLGDGTNFYTRDRYEDWGILAWNDRGIAAVVLNNKVRVLYYSSADQLQATTHTLDTRSSRVTDPPDPGEDWDRRVRFGVVSTFSNISSNNSPNELQGNWKRNLEDRVSDWIQDYRSRGLRYERRDDGAIRASISLQRFDDDGNCDASVSVSLSATTPYGKLTVTGDSSRRIRDRYRDRIQSLVDDAMSELDQNTRRAVDRQKPPSAASYREKALTDFERDLTAK